MLPPPADCFYFAAHFHFAARCHDNVTRQFATMLPLPLPPLSSPLALVDFYCSHVHFGKKEKNSGLMNA